MTDRIRKKSGAKIAKKEKDWRSVSDTVAREIESKNEFIKPQEIWIVLSHSIMLFAAATTMSYLLLEGCCKDLPDLAKR